MPPPADLPPGTDPAASPPAGEVRYSLPALLREVKRDRESAAFAMEKLDQPTINLLFAQQRSRRDASPHQ